MKYGNEAAVQSLILMLPRVINPWRRRLCFQANEERVIITNRGTIDR
jgi:hypothetical protein